MKKTGKFLYLLLILTVLAVFLFSGNRVFNYYREDQASRSLNDNLADKAVTPQTVPADPVPPQVSDPTEPPETAPIAVDFDILAEESRDIVAWIYCEDTVINYPVAQADDNDTYLRHLLDGSYNSSGTLFMDYRNSPDLSDWNTVIYGHHMATGAMFGTLPNYQDQEYYDRHPVIYLLTPTGYYKAELFAGLVTDSDDAGYNPLMTRQERDAYVQSCLSRSTFVADVQIAPDDRLVTFATCAYNTVDARYLVVGVLKQLSAP